MLRDCHGDKEQFDTGLLAKRALGRLPYYQGTVYSGASFTVDSELLLSQLEPGKVFRLFNSSFWPNLMATATVAAALAAVSSSPLGYSVTVVF